MDKNSLALAFAQSSLACEYSKDASISASDALFEFIKAYDFAMNNIDAVYQQVKDSQA